METIKAKSLDLSAKAFEADELSNRITADSIVNIASVIESQTTILLDSAWGTGKTVFVKRLQPYLADRGFPSVYFDAFEHDLTDDAFGSILGTLHSAIRTLTPPMAKLPAKVARVAGVVGKSLLSVGAKVAVNTATAGLLSASDVEKVFKLDKATSESLAKTADELGDRLVERAVAKRVESHHSTVEAIRELRQLMTSVATRASANLADVQINLNSQSRLIVIVDELDRCRPDFALRILEIVKHLLATEKVLFIISTDATQLSNTIKHVYGPGIDAELYLEKFYDFRMSFSYTDPRERTNNATNTYLRKLKISAPDDSDGGQWVGYVVSSLAPYVEHFDISYRTAEKLFNKILLVTIQSAKNQLRPGALIAALVVLEKFKPAVLKKLHAMRLTPEEVGKELGLDRWPEKFVSQKETLQEWLEFALTPADTALSDRLKSMEQSLYRYSIERTRLIPYLCERYIFAFQIRKS